MSTKEPPAPSAPNSLAGTRVTIVVPTYKEVENLPHLFDRIGKVREQQGLLIDVVIMDDNSRDGSAELVAARPESWVDIVVRTGVRGLSPAVLEGLQQAEGDVLICMDADLSHPPEAIPDMLRKLNEGADFVIGSRYVAGGSTSDDWGLFRWLNSRVATLLSRPFTSVRDPMSGFFALRRSKFQEGRDFNPIGYKIGLELLVKCRCVRVAEIPIHFEDRRLGQSKLTFKQQLLYLQHLRRLFIFKYGAWTQLVQFLTVGALGTVVNLVVLTLLVALSVPMHPAVAAAILVSMGSNFVLNRRFSFSAARHEPLVRQMLVFFAASSVGAAINYVVVISMLSSFPKLPPQVAALVGIAVGMTFNFLASRYIVFRKTRPKS